MKIFVAGASGRVGTALVNDLVQAGHQVMAGSRHPQAFSGQDAVTSVNLDLHVPVKDLANTVGQVDAIYFTAGSRGKDLLQTDAFGAVKLMKVARQNHIKRFVMLSSLFALEPEKWAKTPGLDDIMDYNIAKFFADNYLVHDSQLDYTILQPTALTEGSGIGKITIDDGKAGQIPIADVAQTLADVLKYPRTIGQVIKLRTGSTPIETALAAVGK